MFTNIVYLIEIKELNKKYIGSKADCYVVNGIIYDKYNKIYYTSTTVDFFKKYLIAHKYQAVVLKEFDNHDDMIQYERDIQIYYDVVNSELYYNKSIATASNFTSPKYATIYNTELGKHERVLRNELDNTIHIGNTKNRVMYNDGTKHYLLKKDEIIPDHFVKGSLLDLNEKNNPFYGKHHSQQSKNKILETRNNTYKSNPEIMESARKAMSENMRKYAILPKSDEFKSQVSKRMKNKVVLKNINTQESIQVDKNDVNKYDSNIWINAYKYSLLYTETDPETCNHCNTVGNNKNSSFKANHFDRCQYNVNNSRKEWSKLDKNSSRYLVYSKLDLIYNYINSNCIEKVTKKVARHILDYISIDYQLISKNDFRYIHEYIIAKIVIFKYNPLKNEYWFNEFKRDEQ